MNQKVDLESQILIDQNHMHTVNNAGIPCDNSVAADGIARRQTVAALAGDGARRVLAEPDAVRRTGITLDSGDGCMHISGDLLGAYDENDLIRSPDNRCNSVAGTVDVDDFTVQGDGVGAGQHEVR